MKNNKQGLKALPLIFIGLITLLFLPLISASQSLGTFKQNSNVNLIQSCTNSTYANITQVTAPNSEKIITGQYSMTKSGDNYNYTFTSTYQIGTYLVYGSCDENGAYTTWQYDFEITPSGYSDSLGFFIIILIIIISLIALGFFVKDGWFVVIGGMALIIFGIYSINNGVVGYRDMFVTWATGLFMIAVGAYLSVRSTIEMIDEGFGE